MSDTFTVSSVSIQGDHKSFISKAVDFLTEAMKTAKDKVVNFVKGAYQHLEATGLLVLSSLGANAMLSEIPFILAVPLWMEGPLVMPVAAVLIVLGLIKNAERRAKKRAVK